MKIGIFDVKYTVYNKYVLESPEIVIRKLLSIRNEREKCLKALKHTKTIFFDQKLNFFTHISERSTYTNLHHSDLDSGGQIYLKRTQNILCIRQNNVLVEFLQTIVFRDYGFMLGCINRSQRSFDFLI